jgi:hypothetical protein
MFEKATKKFKRMFYPEELVKTFKDRLIKWLVENQILLTVIESDLFYKILQLCEPTIAALLPYSGNIARSWVMEAYELRKKLLKVEILFNSVSKIYISFDLWILPNYISLIGVVAYYTDNTFKNRIVIIALKRLYEAHSGENIGSLLIEIINDFDLKERLGYFVINNVSSNDTCVYYILISLFPDFSEI